VSGDDDGALRENRCLWGQKDAQITAGARHDATECWAFSNSNEQT